MNSIERDPLRTYWRHRTNAGKIVYKRAHRPWTIRRVLDVLLAANFEFDAPTFVPLRAAIKVLVRRAYENYPEKQVKDMLLAMIKDDDGLKNTVRQIYSEAAYWVLNRIPYPEAIKPYIVSFIHDFGVNFLDWLLERPLDL